MSRTKALDKLRAAREAIAAKITDLVNESDDFEDNFGAECDYGDTATLFALGDRLWHINQIITNMPQEVAPEPAKPRLYDPDAQSDGLGQPFGESIYVGAYQPTWADYLSEIDANNLYEASRILEAMSGLRPKTAYSATQVFSAQYALDPEFASKARSLRAQMRTSRQGSLYLLCELFGVSAEIASKMYESMKVAV